MKSRHNYQSGGAILKLTVTLLVIVVTLSGIALLFLLWVDYANPKWVVEKSARVFANRQVEIKGDLDIDVFSSSPGIKAQGVILEGKESPENLLKAEKLKASLDLSNLIGDKDAILEFQLINGLINLSELPERKKEPLVLDFLEFIKSVEISNIEVNSKTYSGKINDLSIDYAAASGQYTLQGSGVFESLPTRLQGIIQPERLENDLFKRPFEVYAQVGLLDAALVGWISGLHHINAELAVAARRPSRLLAAFGLNPVPLPPFKFGAELVYKKDTLTLKEYELSLGETRAYGEFAFRMDRTPFISIETTFNPLRYQDIKNLLEIKSEPMDASPKAQERQAEEKNFFDDEPLPFHVLNEFEGIFKIRIKEYQSPELDPVFQAGILKADLKEGHLDLASSARLSKGFIAAGMDIIAADVPRLNATVKISEVNATDLFQGIIEDVPSKILRPEKMISGELDGFAKLQSKGRSPGEIASHLSGKINLIMRDGYIGSLITEAMSLDILEAAVAWLADNPSTDINCMLIATDIENGKVHTNPLFISSDDANIVGGGTASLEKATLYYIFRSLPKDFSITGASVPIVVKGSFLNPVLNVVTEDLISTAIATILDPIISFIKDILPGIEPERGRTCLKLRDEIKRIDRKSEIFDNGGRRVPQ